MKLIEENTVCAKGQMINSDTIRYYGNPNSSFRILIVGNSITRHGYLKEIGWLHDYGMAASKEENDYVHILMNLWNERGMDYSLCVKQAASFEVMINENNIDLNEFTDIKEFNADLIIFRLAENISGSINQEYLENSVLSFINFINNNNGTVLFTTSFWKNDVVNETLIKLSKINNNILVNISDLGEDNKMKAYGEYQNKGIEAHPGDLGMKNIALRIDEGVKEYVKRKKNL